MFQLIKIDQSSLNIKMNSFQIELALLSNMFTAALKGVFAIDNIPIISKSKGIYVINNDVKDGEGKK